MKWDTCGLSHSLPHPSHARLSLDTPYLNISAFYFGFLMKKEKKQKKKKKEEEEESKKLTLPHHPSKENKHWNAMPPHTHTLQHRAWGLYSS